MVGDRGWRGCSCMAHSGLFGPPFLFVCSALNGILGLLYVGGGGGSPSSSSVARARARVCVGQSSSLCCAVWLHALCDLVCLFPWTWCRGLGGVLAWLVGVGGRRRAVSFPWAGTGSIPWVRNVSCGARVQSPRRRTKREHSCAASSSYCCVIGATNCNWRGTGGPSSVHVLLLSVPIAFGFFFVFVFSAEAVNRSRCDKIKFS